jgi:histidyl-tRNA synthetase
MAYCLKLAEVLRNQHVKVEVYPDNKKFKKQMDFANRSGVKYVGIVGETEVQNNFVKIKNMQSGEQENVASNHLAKLLS